MAEKFLQFSKYFILDGETEEACLSREERAYDGEEMLGV